MCFTLINPSNKVTHTGGYETYHLPPAKIAKKKIVCFKQVKKYRGSKVNRYVTPFQSEAYRSGELKTAKIELQSPKFSRVNIGPGLHSYKTKPFAVRQVSHISGGVRKRFANTAVLECYIPKGAKYYENSSEYVSNKLKVVGPIRSYFH